MSAGEPGPLRVLHGRPADDEVAALVAVVRALERGAPAGEQALARTAGACRAGHAWRHGRDPWRAGGIAGERW